MIKRFIAHGSVSNRKSDMNQFLVCTADADAVHLQERQHDVDADPLVSIHKSVIGDQGIAKPGPFLLLGRIKFLSVKAGICRFQSGFQKAFIPNADAAAGGFGDDLVKQKYLFF